MSLMSYPEVYDSGHAWLGRVPAHWRRKKIRYLLANAPDSMKIGPFGSQLTSEMLMPDGYKVYGQENVIAQDFERGNRYISPAKYAELAVYTVIPGDILITMMGTSGKCVIVPDDAAEGVMDSHLLRIRPSADITPRLLQRLIDEAPYVAHQIAILGKGSIMHGLNSGIVKQLELTVPPISEQCAINHFLDRETAKLDALIDEQEKLLTLLAEKRQATISHAVTKGLNPDVPMKDSGMEWLGKVPAHWEIIKFSRVLVGGTQNGLYKPASEHRPEGTPCISMGEAFSGQVINLEAKDRVVLTDDEYEKYRLFEGDLLFARRSLVFEGSGKCSVIGSESAGQVFESSIIRARLNYNLLIPGLALYFFSSVQGRYQMLSITEQTTISGINSGKLCSSLVLLPPIKEQAHIVQFIENEIARLDLLADEVAHTINLLKERRTALISAAVTGKIDVRYLTDQEAN